MATSGVAAAGLTRPMSSFRAEHRDGMPAPLILRNGKGIVLAIEDNGYTPMFTPGIIYTSMADNWNQSFARTPSPRRWTL